MLKGLARIGSVLLSLCLFCVVAYTQNNIKIVAECTITYSISTEGDNKGLTIKKLYIKGRKTRSEISNPSFSQATIFDNKEGNATVLKEIGGDKYLSVYSAEEWKNKNSVWDSATAITTTETKKILNYTCRKAIIQTKKGIIYEVYYTTDFAASATENPFQFKKITGLILEYKSESKEGKNIECKATDISFIPVPAAKFMVPTSGYRIIK